MEGSDELRNTIEDLLFLSRGVETNSGAALVDPASEETKDADRISFIAEGHSTRLLKKMAFLRDQAGHHLCDVVLQLGSRKIYAHRVVLSACSNYFCAMFTNTMLESHQDTIMLNDLDEKAVEDLVEFAYTSKIDIHEDNVQPLLKAASILQLSEVTTACSEFLAQQLHPSNCLGISNFAEAHGCSELNRTAQQYVVDHFMEVVRFDEYLQLGVEAVKHLVSSDAISVNSEEQVFESMHKWLAHNLSMREKHAYELLNCIRLPLLKPLYLAEHVYAKEVYCCHQGCNALIMKAMIYHMVQEKKAQMRAVVNDMPRKGTMGTMFVIGGMDTSRNKGSIECFDARNDEWKWVCHSQAACRRLQFGVAVLESKVYVVGGRNGLRTLNTVDCYDPANSSWDSVPPMCSYRHGVGVGVMSGPMYAVGGHDGWSYLCSVERYDPCTRQWSYISSMFSARSTAGVAVLDGKLFVVGGRDSNSCLNTVESYDPHTDRWTLLPHLSVARGGVGVTMLAGRLYALGGHEISDPLSSVEVFDPMINEWTFVAPMQCPRDAVAAVAFGGKVYAVGGFDGSMYLNTVECYDPEVDEWKFSSKLMSGRAGAGVIVMPEFPVGAVQLD